jgi:integrase
MTKKLGKLDPATAPVGEYADNVVRLLHLHVSPHGSRAWRIRLREPGGRAKRHTLGYLPDMTQQEARDAALIAHKAIRHRADPKVAIEAREPRTVGEVITKYLASPMAARKKQVTAAYKRGMVQTLRVPTGGKDHFAAIRGKPIAEVRRRDIEILKETAPVEHLRKLRVFFSWAARLEYVEHSPFANVQLPQSGEDVRALITNNEAGIDWRELVAVLSGVEKFAQERPDCPWPSVYRLQLFTAMRPQEVTRLKWEDADLDAEHPTLYVDGKTGRRLIPLTRAAMRVLEQVQPDPAKRESWIFPADRSPAGHLTADPTVHKRIVKLAGTKRPWNRKHLRKTARTWFGAQRQDVLGRLALGHSLEGIDGNYDASDPMPLVRKGMNAFCDAVEAAMNPPTPRARKTVTPLRRVA